LEFRRSSLLLREAGMFGAAVVRADYAAYSKVTEALRMGGAQPPLGRAGFTHAFVVAGYAVSSHLTALSDPEMGKVT